MYHKTMVQTTALQELPSDVVVENDEVTVVPAPSGNAKGVFAFLIDYVYEVDPIKSAADPTEITNPNPNLPRPKRMKQVGRKRACPSLSRLRTSITEETQVAGTEKETTEAEMENETPCAIVTTRCPPQLGPMFLTYHCPSSSNLVGPSERHMYETQKGSHIVYENEQLQSLSSPTDDSDLEWKEGKHYSEEDGESTNVEMTSLTSSDAEHATGQCYDSEEEDHINWKRIRRDGIDLNSDILVPKNEQIYVDGRIVLRQWLRFRDYRHFGDILKDFAVQEGFELKKIKHERIRLTYGCRGIGYPWRVHASITPDQRNFVIKTLNPSHTCQCVRRNRTANSTWLGMKLRRLFQSNPEMNLKGMREHLKNEYGIEVDNRRLWKARRKAKCEIKGDHVQSYGKMRRYASMITATNPGSTAIVQSELVAVETKTVEDGNEASDSIPPIMKPQFKRCFACYEGVKAGFLSGCRPFFGLDGCHLKSPYKGILLSAVGLDANMHFYPIAYAIVEAKNNESWKWFLQLLTEAIGEKTINGQPWCIMSDRQKGLIEAVSTIPDVSHRYCCFHIENNMVKEFVTSYLKNYFWAAAETANLQKFQNFMNQIKLFNKEAYTWLSNIDPKHWTMSCFDPNVKVEHLTNNHVESFNDWIEEVRFKPPIDLLEGLRIQNSNMMYARKVTADRWQEKLTPKIQLKVTEILKKSRFAQVTRVWDYEFQVDYKNNSCSVRLDEGYCICGQWQIRGYPCVHAAACINSIRANIYDYCSNYFKTEQWRKTYEKVIHPLPDESMWPPFEDEHLFPPPVRRQPGRPKKHRRRKVAREERTLKPISSSKTCKNCKEIGHTRRTCKAPPVVEHPAPTTPVQRRGRVRGRGIGRGQSKDKATTSAAPNTNYTQGNRGKGRGRPRGRGRGGIRRATIQDMEQSEIEVEEHAQETEVEELTTIELPLDLFQTQPTQ